MTALATRWFALFRHELLEYRSLWVAPASATVLLLLVALAITLRLPGIELVGDFAGPLRQGIVLSALLTAGLIVGVGALAALAYALHCLHAGRAHRGFLFRHSLSLHASDAEAVLSRAVLAGVVVPLALTAVAIAAHLGLAVALAASPPRGVPGVDLLQLGVLLRTYARLVCLVGVNVLWFLPVLAAALLASARARRSPVTTALLPLLALVATERLLLGSTHALRFLLWRLSPVPAEALASVGLWAGVAVAAGLLYTVIRSCSDRDDT